MIDARVSHHEIIDLEDFPRAQIRGDDRLAGIEIADGRTAGIDQHYFRARQLQHRRVALADVKMRDPQFLALIARVPPVSAIRGEQGNPDRQRGHAIKVIFERKKADQQTVEQRDLQSIGRWHAEIRER